MLSTLRGDVTCPTGREGTFSYISNNGFASPDATSPPSHLGAEGDVTDFGPMDQGEMIGIDLSGIGSLETRTFVLLRRHSERGSCHTLPYQRSGPTPTVWDRRVSPMELKLGRHSRQSSRSTVRASPT